MVTERPSEVHGKPRRSGYALVFVCAAVMGGVILLPVLSQSFYTFVQEPMVDAARNGDLLSVKHLLNLGANVDGEADDALGTALIGASAEGHTAVVRLLIRRGADVDKPALYFGDIETPLAAAAKHPDIIALLKKAGASE